MTTNRTLLLTQSVETATKKLLDHFQTQYGSLIFLPLGVNANTPTKIAPNVANNLERFILKDEGDRITMIITDETVGQVFDAFITSFFDSLNFIAKGIMKTLGMKMLWKDFARDLAEHKIKNPATYEKWKKNLTMVLQEVFEQVTIDLKNQGQELVISNEIQNFNDIASVLNSLEIFQ